MDRAMDGSINRRADGWIYRLIIEIQAERGEDGFQNGEGEAKGQEERENNYMLICYTSPLLT